MWMVRLDGPRTEIRLGGRSKGHGQCEVRVGRDGGTVEIGENEVAVRLEISQKEMGIRRLARVR